MITWRAVVFFKHVLCDRLAVLALKGGHLHRYAAEFNVTLAAAPVAATVEAARNASGDVRLLYESQEGYELITARLRMLREWKDGVPRAGYQGVVRPSLRTSRWEFCGNRKRWLGSDKIDIKEHCWGCRTSCVQCMLQALYCMSKSVKMSHSTYSTP